MSEKPEKVRTMWLLMTWLLMVVAALDIYSGHRLEAFFFIAASIFARAVYDILGALGGVRP